MGSPRLVPLFACENIIKGFVRRGRPGNEARGHQYPVLNLQTLTVALSPPPLLLCTRVVVLLKVSLSC